MRRVIVGLALFTFLVGLLAPTWSSAATISELSTRAAQAKSRAIKLKSGGKDAQLQAIGLIGPIAMDFVGASDLSRSVKTSRSRVRQIYNDLSGPLKDIYVDNTNKTERWMKDVMAVDGDLEALYETQKWRDAQDVSARALYFLNWLNYVGSYVYDGKKQTKMLEEAINGFSEFASGPASSIKRETLFGRALSERELGEYDWAIRDFEILLKDRATSSDMRKKASNALQETRRLAQGGKKRRRNVAPSADEIFERQLAEARDLFKRSLRERGRKRQKTRERGIGLALGVKQSKDTDDSWIKAADELLAEYLNDEEKLALNPYVPWRNAAERIRKGQFNKAIPELRTVIASDDPRAQRYKQDAQYYLADALIRIGSLRKGIKELDIYLSSNPSKNVVNASYLRFKAAESLFAQSQNQANGLLYVDAAKEFIRRDTKNTTKAVHEAHFRLGEYYHGQKNYLKAVDSYRQVSGSTDFRFRADFATLQSYFSLYEQLEENPKADIGLSPADLKKRIDTALAAFEKSSAVFEKQKLSDKKRENLRNYRGRIKFMNAVLLSEDMNANAVQIADLLEDFEQKYPVHKDAFETVARVRLITLEKAGRFVDIEKNVDYIYANYKGEKRDEILKSLDQVLSTRIDKLKKKKDTDNLLAARRTLARLNADRLERGEFAEDESPDKFKYELAQLYLDVKDYDRAAALYTQLQDGAYSLVSLAGLAQIADVQGNKREALQYWETMLKESRAGDPIWFRGSYESAVLHESLGDPQAACRTARGTRAMLGRLGDLRLKQQIQEFVTKHCEV